MTVGQLARLSLQLGYYLFLARRLGADEFGAFATAVAATFLIAPVASMGAAHVLTRGLAVEPGRYHERIGESRATVLLGAIVGTAVLSAAVPPLVGLPVVLVAVVAVTDLAFHRLLDLDHRSALALGESGFSAFLLVLVPGARLIGVVVWDLSAVPNDAIGWSWTYLLSTTVAVGVGLGVVRRRFGGARPRLGRLRLAWREGRAFVVTDVAHNVNNDIDRTMLGALRGTFEAGVYSAASRLVDALLVPLRSLAGVAYPEFFRVGRHGAESAARLARRLLPGPIVYGVAVGGLLWLAAPLLPTLLGDDYASAVPVLRWLSPVLIARGTGQLAADTLSGSGRQALRAWIQTGAAMTNVGLNLWLIPTRGLDGAVWATLASDFAGATALWTAAVVVSTTPVPKP